jgi:hypothetical protein
MGTTRLCGGWNMVGMKSTEGWDAGEDLRVACWRWVGTKADRLGLENFEVENHHRTGNGVATGVENGQGGLTWLNGVGQG